MTIDVVVIGAGQAGLAASRHLAARGIEHAVLERGSIGDTWRSQRWDSFVLNTPNWMNRLPGETDDIQPRDAFLTRTEYIARLERYVSEGHLPVRTDTSVDAVTVASGAGEFRIEISRGGGAGEARAAGEELVARNVVVASGMQRIVKVPALAGSMPAWLYQSTAADYRRPDALQAGAVLVVGSGQSGVQIAEDLLDAGRTVYLCTSAVARLPRRYRGADSFEWLYRAGFWDVRLDALPDPQMRHARLPTISGVGRFGHTVSLTSLQGRGAHLLGRPSDVDGDRLLLDDTVAANIAFNDRTSAEVKADIDRGIVESGARLPPTEPDPADEPNPDPDSVHSPPFIDLSAAGIGTVIWTTGFTADFGFLRLPGALDPTGLPLQALGVAPIPGLYHVGYPWISKRKSGIIHGADEDAAYVVDTVSGRLVTG